MTLLIALQFLWASEKNPDGEFLSPPSWESGGRGSGGGRLPTTFCLASLCGVNRGLWQGLKEET